MCFQNKCGFVCVKMWTFVILLSWTRYLHACTKIKRYCPRVIHWNLKDKCLELFRFSSLSIYLSIVQTLAHTSWDVKVKVHVVKLLHLPFTDYFVHFVASVCHCWSMSNVFHVYPFTEHSVYVKGQQHDQIQKPHQQELLFPAQYTYTKTHDF